MTELTQEQFNWLIPGIDDCTGTPGELVNFEYIDDQESKFRLRVISYSGPVVEIRTYELRNVYLSVWPNTNWVSSDSYKCRLGDKGTVRLYSALTKLSPQAPTAYYLAMKMNLFIRYSSHWENH